MRLTAKQVRRALPPKVAESRSEHIADLARELARREMLGGSKSDNAQNRKRIAELRRIIAGG